MGRHKQSYDPAVSTMSLGDHLEELRARLIMALLGLFIGTLISFTFGKGVIRFIEKPYYNVMTQYVAKHVADVNVAGATSLVELFSNNLIGALESDPNAPALDARTIRFMQQIYQQSEEQWQAQGPGTPWAFSETQLPRLQILAPADAFVGFMKISLICGLILSAPWVFYQLWMFIAAGLYEHERRSIQTTIPFSAGLFIVGALFFLFVVAPISLKFFLGFGDLIGVRCHWTFQKYISFVTVLMLVFGLAFQTPIVIFILNRTGLIAIEILTSYRRFVILGIVFLAAVVTPPDVVSQITLAIPLYLLYELGILLSVKFNPQPSS